MTRSMKLLLAYDGSVHADAAISDLCRAGLPPTGEALIASVADISRIAVEDPYELGVLGKYVSSRILEETLELTRKEVTEMLNNARKLAVRGGRKLLARLPGWRVTSRSSAGDPARELLRTAADRELDLIVTGSHGRGTVGRFFLGSISRKIAEKANCSVRVARRSAGGGDDLTNRIIVGARSLQDAEVLIRTIHDRRWEGTTIIRLIKADDHAMPNGVYPYSNSTLNQLMIELRATGVDASVESMTGNLGPILLNEAEKWNADSIFVLAGNGGEGPNLNESSAALINDARCAVELVRPVREKESWK